MLINTFGGNYLTIINTANSNDDGIFCNAVSIVLNSKAKKKEVGMLS